MKNINTTPLAQASRTQVKSAVRCSLIGIAALSTATVAQAQDPNGSDIVFVSNPVVQGEYKAATSTTAIAAATVQAPVAPAPAANSNLAPATPVAVAASAQSGDVNGDTHVVYRRGDDSERERGIVTSKDAHEIRFRADTLVVTPVLNVGLVEADRTAVVGEPVTFMTYNNYPAFVEKSEVRVFRAEATPDSEPLTVLEVDQLGAARWEVPGDVPSALYYVLRVFGADGKFDETSARELTILDEALPDIAGEEKVNRPNFGTIDEAAIRNIELGGMMATVTGFADPDKDIVSVAGQAVPVDADGRFVAQQIVARRGPSSTLTVKVERDGKTIKQAEQSFATPKDDWFIVGQGDITLGESFSSGPAAEVSGDSLAEGSYAIGRAAFYAKGVIGDDDYDDSNDWRITASLDTGETLLEDLFSNLDRKDPTQLLRRLNRDQFYPTYGDNSTTVEDAPTQGRFYLRVAKDESQLVIGNFVTSLNGAELAQLDRGLFGALIDYNTTDVTSFGERKAQIT
nr:hypothetical protein [Gammaproteobacteria bacterium]